MNLLLIKKEKNGIINEVIRDDVFDILKEECVVLYYALDDSRVEGCHMIKPMQGKVEQFVLSTLLRQSKSKHGRQHMSWGMYGRWIIM